MLTRSIKRIVGFFEIFARIKKFEFFGQLIKSILQSTNGEEKLINVSQILVKLCNGKITSCAKCYKISKENIKIGQIREKLKNTFNWPFLEQKFFFNQNVSQ